MLAMGWIREGLLAFHVGYVLFLLSQNNKVYNGKAR